MEVCRFAQSWERDASAGDMAAWAQYSSRGAVQEGPQDRVYDRALMWWANDTRQGKTSLLLAGTNEEAARLAGMARERRIEAGEIPGGREITLRDGNPASQGDLVRQLGHQGAEDRQWSDEFTVPAAYLEQNGEPAYAGNVFVAQGRTVDTAHLVVSEGMTRDLLFVGMTRGREENTPTS